MPQVKVEQEIKGKRKDVYDAVKTYLDGRETLSKLGAEMEWSDKSFAGKISGGSFSGTLSVIEGGAKSVVAITIDLPLLMTPFKGKVEDELKKHLGRVKV